MSNLNVVELGAPKLSLRSASVLSAIFNNEMLRLGSMKEPNLQKEIQVKELHIAIKDFVFNNKYSDFTLIVLSPDEEKIDPLPTSALSDFEFRFKNYDKQLKVQAPRRFIIVLNSVWSSFTVYQFSMDNQLLKDFCYAKK